MIEFNVLNRFTGTVQFVAKIDCGEGEPTPNKMRLAVKWAGKNNANLGDADLSGANLRRANLRRANLGDADLSDADLSGANLRRANLRRANLGGIVGEKKHIKTLLIEDYSISYTSEILQIGCQGFPIAKWWEFTDAEIVQMDGEKALAFWRKWKDWLRDLIKVRSPAEPTSYEKKERSAI